jgi:hypothetical protein
MSKPPLTPAETSQADELMAFARDDLTELTAVIRRGDAEKGVTQNGANFVAYLCERHNPEYLAALVVAAARQLGNPS